MEYALPIIEQIAMMFIIILIGYILFKLNIITVDGRKQLSEIMLTIVCPALIFMVFQKDFSPEIMNGLLWSFLLSFISVIIGIVVAALSVRKSSEDYNIGRFCIAYTNCAFMGIPLIYGMFGDEGVLYLTAYITFFNIFVWSHGVMQIKQQSGFKELLGILRSPTIISVILALLCFVTGFRIPSVPATALNYIKELNTPIAMLIAGATMAQSDMLGAVRKIKIMWPVFVKLIVVPLVVVLVFKLLPVPSEMVFTSNVIAAACPTATIGTMFALRYGKNATMASELFAISTLLSAVSLPLVALFSNYIFNL